MIWRRYKAPAHGIRLSDERVPLLADVLELTTAKTIGLVLEMKPTWGWDADVAIAQAALIPEAPQFPLLVSSFSVSTLRAMRAARPDIDLAHQNPKRRGVGGAGPWPARGPLQ